MLPEPDFHSNVFEEITDLELGSTSLFKYPHPFPATGINKLVSDTITFEFLNIKDCCP